MTDAALDLVALGADVEWTDVPAAARARPVGVVVGGRLGELIEWLAATQGRFPVDPPARIRAVVLGPVTPEVLALADELDVPVRAVELPAGADVEAAYALGVAVADDEVDSGTDLLIVADPDESEAGALLVAVLSGAEPVALLPRGAAAVDTDAWIAHAIALRDGRRRLAPLRSNPSALLTALDHPRTAATVALITRAVARRTPVVLDGTAAVTAALLCHDTQTRASRWWRIADASPDPVHRRAVAELGQQPVLDVAVRRGDGTAGLLAVPVLRAAARLGHSPVGAA